MQEHAQAVENPRKVFSYSPSFSVVRVVGAISCYALDCLLLCHLSQCFSSASSKLYQDRSFTNLLRCEP